MTDQDSVKKSREQAQTILQDILRLMGFEAKVEAFDQPENEVLLHVDSPDAGRLIGRDAQGLEALQLVMTRMTGRHAEQPVRFTVDVEHYLERKKDRLQKMALDAAEQVRQTGQPVKLAPMNSSERRIIHQALKDAKGLRTYSEVLDEANEKRVIVDRADSAPTASDQPPASSV
jgi:spoIIIJ-associated protein